MATEVLRESGYTVLSATCGADALQVVERYQCVIDILLTDVVMPGMNGRELADQVASLSPATKVLYMSGYTDDAIRNHGVREQSLAVIAKPFTHETLIRRVSDALEGTPGA